VTDAQPPSKKIIQLFFLMLQTCDNPVAAGFAWRSNVCRRDPAVISILTYINSKISLIETRGLSCAQGFALKTPLRRKHQHGPELNRIIDVNVVFRRPLLLQIFLLAAVFF
jgi:hypothetical protein